MLKLVLFSATSISCNSRRLREVQRGGRLRLSLKKLKFTLLFQWYFSIAGGGMNVPVQVVCVCSTIVQQLINMS